jgi:hypothetical protein
LARDGEDARQFEWPTLVDPPLTDYYLRVNLDDAIARIKQIEPAIRAGGSARPRSVGTTAHYKARLTSNFNICIGKGLAMSFGPIERPVSSVL